MRKSLILSLSLTRVSLTHKSPLFVDQFGSSLLFWNIEFDKEAISDGFVAHFRVFRDGFESISD